MVQMHSFPDTLNIRFIETKPGVSEIYLPLANGHYCRVGAKTEIWYRYDDGFMWHDVFHIAYMALLGWSPVSRFLLGLSRHHENEEYGYEDGYRAMIIEEAITAFIIEEAKERDYYSTQSVSEELLHIIQCLVGHFEVSRQSTVAWSEAIVKACRVWKHLIESRGGIVQADALHRDLIYRGNPDLRQAPVI